MRFLLRSAILAVFSIIALNAQPEELIANNGILKVKLDLTRGGVISYISLSGSSRNLVNIYDEGRYIQQSYYAGKSTDRRDEGQSPKWSPWCWNPVQVGDEFHNRAKILGYKQAGDTFWVKCVPMQWDMNNKPAAAEMEQETILSGNILHVYCKLTCLIIDTIYDAGNSVNQELPAVYPVSSLQNLYAYLGKNPFTNDTVSNPPVVFLSSGFWGRYPEVSEHWMAFVDSAKWGMGVYNPVCTNFIAGMSGHSGGESKDGSTCYIAPVKEEALKNNSVYKYDYYIIIGKVDDIRSKVYELNNANE